MEFSPKEIANYFIAKSRATGGELTPMKAIKLSYIAHGWNLGLYGNSLIDEPIYAWKYGPVIETLYQTLKQYKNSQITDDIPVETQQLIVDSQSVELLDKIWETYGSLTGLQLSTLTHQSGTPWDIVWNKQGGSKRDYAIIPNELIKKHYQDKAAQVAAE